MQKVLDFLEKYVQWVAVGVAALFLGWALYSYMPVVTHPVEVTLGNELLTPGEVDPKIREVAEQLQQRIDQDPPFSLKVPDFAQQLLATLKTSEKTGELPKTFLAFQKIEYPPGFDPSKAIETSGATNSGKVASLPVLPAAILDPAPTTGFAQVSVTPVPANGAAPAAPAAPAGAAAAATSTANTDTTWVRVPFTISAGGLANAFRAVNLPQNWSSTSFLRVELIRQKQLPGDEWGPEEVVQPLPTLALLPMPAPGPNNFAAQQAYLGWANTNQVPLVQPEFFPVVAGADPRMIQPDATTPADQTATVFDPETFPPNGDLSKLTKEQKDAVLKARQRKAEEEKKNRPKPAPTNPGGSGSGRPRGGRGGAGAGGPFGPREVPSATPTPIAAPSGILFRDAQTPMRQQRPGQPGTGFPGNFPGAAGGDTGIPGGMGPGGMPPGMNPGVPTAATPITVIALPAAPFQPAAVPNEIQGWAYDVTAIADSTYRYRIRYHILNPIFGAQNVAANNQLPQVFSIIGEDKTKWTDPIAIAPLTHIYLTQQATPSSSAVKFTVFRWQAGKQHRAQVIVAPGDSIGKVDGDIDYRTHWTLVEVRRDSSSDRPYALLMNADGVLKRLDYEVDSKSEEFAKLNAEVDGTTLNPGATPGAPTGMPPGATPGGRPGGRPGGEAPVP